MAPGSLRSSLAGRVERRLLVPRQRIRVPRRVCRGWRLGSYTGVTNDQEAEKWLQANGWRRVDLAGQRVMWTHDYLHRESGRKALTFIAAIERQKRWDGRRFG
jgi:hypothetical protein